jgi:hypothetical protein
LGRDFFTAAASRDSHLLMIASVSDCRPFATSSRAV